MAIIIQNMGGNPLGECEYRLQINNKTIAYFTHSRPDGLAECLRRAAKAAEKAKWDETAAMMNAFLEPKKE